MSHCRGSPSLVTLVQVCAYLDPIVGSAHAYLRRHQRPESTEREHMSGQEGSAPQSLLDLEDTRVRYDTYHGSTGLPPGSKSAGEPIQHEQAVQGELGMRKAENRVIEKSRNQQHDQGLGALRSSRITHMTPKVTQGLARQVNAPVSTRLTPLEH